jgi:hypothetical protein
MNENFPIKEMTGQESFLCPSCAYPVPVTDVFCRKCNSPIGLLTSPDPIQQAHMEGFVYAKALDRRPKLVVVIGVWLLFFPVFGFAAFGTIALLVNFTNNGLMGAVMFLLAVIVLYYSAKMLFIVTKNYFKKRETEDGEIQQVQ